MGPRTPKKKGGYKKGNCPVSKGEILTLEIVDMSERGDGVAKVEDFTIFIPDAKIGDRVTVKITEIKKTCAEARVME